MCEITTALKKRFCTDNNLSIQLFEEPYFMDRIWLFNKQAEWERFEEMLSGYKTDEDFFAEYNQLKDAAIQFIKSSEAFESLNNEPSEVFNVKEFNLPDRDTYKEMNVGRWYMSIDMAKANFTCLVYYGKKTGKQFYDHYDYDRFIGQFTDKDYFMKSKYIRQVIFGNCNCKRVIAYEKVMMAGLLKQILNTVGGQGITVDHVYSLRADEIIFDLTDMTKEQQDVLFRLSLDLGLRIAVGGFPVNVENYRIKKFKGEDVYVKVFNDDSFEIKKASNEDMPSVYRYMEGYERNDLDQYFYHNGRIAHFVEPKVWELEN